MSGEATNWPSGIAGAQCDNCGETTILRGFDRDALGEPQSYLCRECYMGGDEYVESDADA